MICGQLKYKKDTKNIVYVKFNVVKTLLKPTISIDMKYTKNVFYIKHLEIYLPLVFVRTRIALKDTLKKYLDDVQEFLQTFYDAEKKRS